MRSARRFLPGRRSPRFPQRSRRRAGAGGGSRSSRTPIATSSRRRSAQIGVPFDETIVASEVGSYKPALGHWQAFEEEVGRLPDVHVAASHFHDVVPASGLGLPTVWVNRLAEHGDPPPTREIRGSRAAGGRARRARPRVTQLEFRRGARGGRGRPLPSSATRSNARFSHEPEIVSADDILRCSGAARARRGSSSTTGTLVGFAYVQRRGERWDGDGYVHPDAFGRGVGTAIVDWIEDARRESSARRRRGSASSTQDERAACLLRQPRVRADPELLPHGDRARRRARRRRRGRTASWSRTLVPGEERVLYEVLEDAFLDHWGHSAAHLRGVDATHELEHELCLPRPHRQRASRPERSASATSSGWAGSTSSAPAGSTAAAASARRCSRHVLPRALRPRRAPDRSRRRRREPDRRDQALRARRHASRLPDRTLRQEPVGR